MRGGGKLLLFSCLRFIVKASGFLDTEEAIENQLDMT